MPSYGRDFDRSRYDERPPERGLRGRGEYGWGGYLGGRRYRGFDEDSVDELSGYGPGGGAYDSEFDTGFRSGDRYGGPGRGGYLSGGWSGRGYEGRDERDFGGYERGSAGAWGGWSGGARPEGRGGWGGRDSFGERGYDGYERGGGGGDELRRLRAADIMTENPECVTPDVSLADAARKMRDLDVGIIPVVESEGNRRLRGVITDRDIAIRAVADGLDATTTRVSEVMTTRVETCNKNDPVQNVLRLMEREQVRRVPITDRDGRLVGIIAQADVATDLDDDRSEQRVADTLERISEPGRGRGMSASRGRTSLGGGSSGPRGETGADTGMPRNTDENL